MWNSEPFHFIVALALQMVQHPWPRACFHLFYLMCKQLLLFPAASLLGLQRSWQVISCSCSHAPQNCFSLCSVWAGLWLARQLFFWFKKKKKKHLKMSFVHVEWGIVRSMLDFKQINTDFSVLLLYFFKRIKNKGFFLVLNIPRGKMDGTDL